MIHYDTSKTADLQAVLDNGMVWSGGQRALTDLLAGLRAGTVTMTDAARAKMPPWAADMLSQAGISTLKPAPAAPATASDVYTQAETRPAAQDPNA